MEFKHYGEAPKNVADAIIERRARSASSITHCGTVRRDAALPVAREFRRRRK